MEHMGWVVLTFTAGRCTETDWPACPMSADWFETREEAVAYCDTLPGWTNPHMMPVSRRTREEEA